MDVKLNQGRRKAQVSDLLRGAFNVLELPQQKSETRRYIEPRKTSRCPSTSLDRSSSVEDRLSLNTTVALIAPSFRIVQMEPSRPARSPLKSSYIMLVPPNSPTVLDADHTDTLHTSEAGVSKDLHDCTDVALCETAIPFDWTSHGFDIDDIDDAHFQPIKKDRYLGVITLRNKVQSTYQIIVNCAQKEEIFRQLEATARVGSQSNESECNHVQNDVESPRMNSGGHFRRATGLSVNCIHGPHSPLQSRFSPDTPEYSEQGGTTCSETGDRPSPAYSQGSFDAGNNDGKRVSWTANRI